MKQIPLSQGKVALVDDQDHEMLMQWKWAATEHHGGKFYAKTNYTLPDGKKTVLYMHRVIMKPLTGQVVDHADHDGLNNQRANLRVTSQMNNRRYQRNVRANKTGFKGVKVEGKRFAALICANYKTHRVGSFSTAEEAARAYDKAALEMFGPDFAALNFPTQ